ncbi:DUF4403 family protein [Rhodopseudomonas palustris]|uniref:DUF4403 family protein n=1 Tax=Rhodopseudomonas palustris (strain ATCC BAA-98 / CGA009) TaxID=258594 RepID=Q6N3X5_RHOPA|nr:DUF4403 family protein [Rhodopseudomonas palustris]ACF02582.1 conserved hypothetical protein [Rhodopseudomonas palustris TIE-1]OPF97630.1 hypothetical protein B1S06_00205 [Rhodopseudomonas palustris]PPQ42838.1 DUF4403 domain-containing protein [Rhodopseudomonas palustris]QLH72585.1 DUF4403 family protein [Rhodopseudomonas palustris]QQM05114.1 hypothetical protein I8G32_03682 [Rhodopseudomonas palustris]
MRFVKFGLVALAIVAISFTVTLKAFDWLAPRAISPPSLQALPPLPPIRQSTVVVPVSVPLGTIRDLVDAVAPRTFSGKANNPLSQYVQNADIQWTATRGAVTVRGAKDQLTITSPLTGTVNAKGSLSANTQSKVDETLGRLLGNKVAKQIGVNIKSFNANGELKGTIAISARPQVLPNWHVDPHLDAEVALSDSGVSVGGVRIDVPQQVKPVIDKAIADQLGVLERQIRDDSALERSARREWDRLCRSVPLQGAGIPNGFFLEIRPTRALAAQPQVDAAAATLTLGIVADTRITAGPTKPQCPFPPALQMVAPDTAGVKVAVPIDIPFQELDRILEAQFVGKTFPEGDSRAAITVKRAKLAASGDRLLISLLVDAKENRSFFGFGTEATLHIWGRPTLDQEDQTLRLSDIKLAVESEAAFGLLGDTARAAVPYLEKAIADKAVIDLKPESTNIQRRVGNMIATYQRNEDGLRISSEISSLRLSDLVFDSNMLRITAEANGILEVKVTRLKPPELPKPAPR